MIAALLLLLALVPAASAAGLELEEGWNLVPVYAYDLEEYIDDGSVRAVWIYSPWYNEYLNVEPRPDDRLEEIEEYMRNDPGREAALVSSSFWVYAEDEMTLDGFDWDDFALEDIRLHDGWNFLSIRPDMLDERLGDILFSCDVEQMYWWDSQEQDWEDVSLDAVPPADVVHTGLVIKTDDDCWLRDALIEPPALPGDDDPQPEPQVPITIDLYDNDDFVFYVGDDKYVIEETDIDLKDEVSFEVSGKHDSIEMRLEPGDMDYLRDVEITLLDIEFDGNDYFAVLRIEYALQEEIPEYVIVVADNSSTGDVVLAYDMQESIEELLPSGSPTPIIQFFSYFDSMENYDLVVAIKDGDVAILNGRNPNQLAHQMLNAAIDTAVREDARFAIYPISNFDTPDEAFPLTFDTWVWLELGPENALIDVFGVTYELRIAGASSDPESIVLEINGNRMTVEQGEDFSYDDIEIVVDEVFVSNIPTLAATAVLHITA